jgi:HPt (histidine-containing phosphotransfer) domain-containing protein
MKNLMNEEKAGTPPVFDAAEALSIVDGDRDLFQELVHLFRGSYAAELKAIREAIGRRDSEALRRASHHLKGTLGTLAAGPARHTALRLEDLGSSADFDPAPAVCLEMEQQLRALDQALSSWR